MNIWIDVLRCVPVDQRPAAIREGLDTRRDQIIEHLVGRARNAAIRVHEKMDALERRRAAQEKDPDLVAR